MRKIHAFICLLALVATGFQLFAHVASAGTPSPGAPALPQDRKIEPVVLTGSQFPMWSAGPEVSYREPTQPPNSSCDPHPSDGLVHNCSEEPTISNKGLNLEGQKINNPIPNPRTGADVKKLIGYKWDGEAKSFVQIPFQVDERFTRYISNLASNCSSAGPFCVGFGAYAGADKQPSFVYDRDTYKYTGGTCFATPEGVRAGDDGGPEQDPIQGLDDNDELVFLDRDAGMQAPASALEAAHLPHGIAAMQVVRIDDPSRTGSKPSYAYVGLSNDPDVNPAFNAENGYMHYVRDADSFQYEQTSGNYGNAPKGVICDADGHVIRTNVPRRPKDTAWVLTPRYAFRYASRWMLQGVRVNPDPNATKPLASPDDYGPPLVDQWKARAYAQKPNDDVPCCGFENEQTHWGGTSVTDGEKAGPVRVIRTTQGADSGTNTLRTEIFYPDLIVQQNYLRVHPLPPLGGIFSYWDHTAGVITKYYNPERSDGVDVDGVNDEVVGNGYVALRSGGIEAHDEDPAFAGLPGGVGSTSAGCVTECAHIDVTDPTLNATGTASWEEVTGPSGSMVFRQRLNTDPNHLSPGDAQSLATIPYYRDDKCYDDGTGFDPGPADTNQGNGSVERPCNWSAGATPPAGGWRQGLFGAHGVQVLITPESDNAASAGTVPVTEVDAELRMVVLPGNPGNVGEQYAHANDAPLQATVNGTVSPDTTSIALGGDSSKTIGQTAHFTATVTDKAGLPVSNANVQFNFQGMVKSATADTQGKAAIDFDVRSPAGATTVSATYEGDDMLRSASYAEKPFTVDKVATTVTMDPSSATSGQVNHPVVFSAKLVDAQPVAGATLHFAFQGKTYDATTNANGVASTDLITVNGPAGTSPLHVSFDGDDDRLPSSTDQDVSVAKDDTILEFTDASHTSAQVNQTARLVANLSDSVGGLSGRTVHFTFQGKNYDVTTDENGDATKNVVVAGPAGETTVAATFDGDDSHDVSMGTETFTVAPDSSSVRFNSDSATTASIGAKAHFAVTLRDSAGPVSGATVKFTFQGASYDATTGANGVATTDVTVKAPVGTATVTASFAGDGSHDPSSASASVSVSKKKPKPKKR